MPETLAILVRLARKSRNILKYISLGLQHKYIILSSLNIVCTMHMYLLYIYIKVASIAPYSIMSNHICIRISKQRKNNVRNKFYNTQKFIVYTHIHMNCGMKFEVSPQRVHENFMCNSTQFWNWMKKKNWTTDTVADAKIVNEVQVTHMYREKKNFTEKLWNVNSPAAMHCVLWLVNARIR